MIYWTLEQNQIQSIISNYFYVDLFSSHCARLGPDHLPRVPLQGHCNW